MGFSLNYLANIPEVIDLAKETKRDRMPECFVFAGGHSASFTAKQILAHAEGAITCVVRGEGEEVTPSVLDAAHDPEKLHALPGVTSIYGDGPAPRLVHDLNALHPAQDLLAKRRKYFIGVLDPVRFDRVHARLSLGLFVLQRVDILRTELPAAKTGSSSGNARANRGTRRFHRG